MVGKAGLIVVVGFSIILGFMSMNMARLGKKAVNNMSSYNDATLSHNLASAGANIGLARFYADTSWRGDTTQVMSGSIFNGSIRYGVANNPSVPNQVRLQAISTYQSPTLPIAEVLHDTVMVYLNTNNSSTFSKFAWMTNDEGGVNWTTADTVWGLVHSNGTLYVDGKPVFMQKVTTSASFSPAPGKSSGGRTNNAIFKNGYETSVPTHEFPNNLAGMDSASQSHGRKYLGTTYPNIYITLNPGTAANNDGFAIVRNSSYTSGTLNDTLRYNSAGFNGVITSSGRIHTKGVVDGQLSIAALNATKGIWVDDTVRYANNPLLDSLSDDLLGLCSQDSVVITDNAANNSDCSIDACIFANNTFTAQNYDKTTGSPAVGVKFGTLKITGSIVQRTRGPVAKISSGVVSSGFSKRYRFDNRLTETFKPPCFPNYLTKVYAIANWWESMRVPNLRE